MDVTQPTMPSQQHPFFMYQPPQPSLFQPQQHQPFMYGQQPQQQQQQQPSGLYGSSNGLDHSPFVGVGGAAVVASSSAAVTSSSVGMLPSAPPRPTANGLMFAGHFNGSFSPEALLGTGGPPAASSSSSAAANNTEIAPPAVEVSPALRDAVNRFLQDMSQQQTLIVWNSKVAQKSYGTEKRYVVLILLFSNYNYLRQGSSALLLRSNSSATTGDGATRPRVIPCCLSVLSFF